MNEISLFYVDEKEMLYLKDNKEVERKVISKEDNTINAKRSAWPESGRNGVWAV